MVLPPPRPRAPVPPESRGRTGREGLPLVPEMVTKSARETRAPSEVPPESTLMRKEGTENKDTQGTRTQEEAVRPITPVLHLCHINSIYQFIKLNSLEVGIRGGELGMQDGRGGRGGGSENSGASTDITRKFDVQIMQKYIYNQIEFRKLHCPFDETILSTSQS